MNVSCPKCHRSIPMEDINVSTDIALCRECGETFSFSELSSVVSDTAPVDFGNPPDHVKVELDPMDGSFTLTHHRFDKTALFLIPFTMFWGGGSLTGIYGSQIWKHAFDWKVSLFGLPFLVGTIVLVSVCLYMVFGKTRVRLVMGKGSVFRGVGGIGWTRRFSYSTRTTVRVASASYVQKGSTRTVYRIDIEDTDRGTVSVKGNFTQVERDYIAGAIARRLTR